MTAEAAGVAGVAGGSKKHQKLRNKKGSWQDRVVRGLVTAGTVGVARGSKISKNKKVKKGVKKKPCRTELGVG